MTIVTVAQAKETIAEMAPAYKSWLKHHGVVSSYQSAIAFIKYYEPDWPTKWGMIMMDTIAEGLHNYFIQ